MKPRLIVEQKITAFVNRYEVYQANEEGKKVELVAFAEQKRLAFKEKVSFFADKDKQQLAFTFRAEKVMDVHGRYFVEGADGKLLGAFRKQFAKSLLNSTWDVLDTSDQPIMTINESNMFLAVVRRFGGWIPIVGEFIEILTAFFRYHFVFKSPDGSQIFGTYTKTTLFFDRYRLDLTDEAYDANDWRVMVAMAVALDALQSR